MGEGGIVTTMVSNEFFFNKIDELRKQWSYERNPVKKKILEARGKCIKNALEIRGAYIQKKID